MSQNSQCEGQQGFDFFEAMLADAKRAAEAAGESFGPHEKAHAMRQFYNAAPHKEKLGPKHTRAELHEMAMDRAIARREEIRKRKMEREKRIARNKARRESERLERQAAAEAKREASWRKHNATHHNRLTCQRCWKRHETHGDVEAIPEPMSQAQRDAFAARCEAFMQGGIEAAVALLK